MNVIPQVLKDARVYADGHDFVARAKTIKLPDVKHVTETYEGLGTAGPIDLPLQGIVENLEGSIAFAGTSQDVYRFLDAGRAQLLDCRASQTGQEPVTGLQVEMPIRAVVRAVFHSMESPDQERAQADGPTFTYSALYYKLDVDGETVLEIDKLAGICKVRRAGALVDLNLQTRVNLGQV